MKKTILFLGLAVLSLSALAQENYFPLTAGDWALYRRDVIQDYALFLRHTVEEKLTVGGYEYTKIKREFWNSNEEGPDTATYFYYLYEPCSGLYLRTTSTTTILPLPVGTHSPVGSSVIMTPYLHNDETMLVLEVEEVGEVTVPAGTFQNCYQVEGTTSVSPSDHPITKMTLAPDVGIISWGTGGGLVEPNQFILVDQSITPASLPEVPADEQLIEIDHFHRLEGHAQFSEPTHLGTSGVKPFFGVCADSSSASRFVVTPLLNGNGQSLVDLNEVELSISGADMEGERIRGRLEIVEQTSSQIIADYLHPEALPDNADRFHTLELEVRRPLEECRLVGRVPIRVFRAPLMLIHGLFGNEESMAGLKSYLIEEQLYLPPFVRMVNYEATNDLSFSRNRTVVQDNIDRLIEDGLELNVAMGKVDIVAHSMGGILSRLYQQRSDYRFDINKLITLNTPHAGSQIANLLLDPAIDADQLEALCSIYGIITGNNCQGGAVKDLRVDSKVIRDTLNGIEVDRNPLNAHAVVTTETSNATVEAFLLWRLTGSFAILDDIFDGETHDLVVAWSSQVGGLSTRSEFTNIHVGSYNNSEVQQRIVELLKMPTSSDDFSKEGFLPPFLSYETPPLSPFNYLNVSFESIIEGEIYEYGDNIAVDIEADTDADDVLFMVGDNASSADFLEQYQTPSVSTSYNLAPRSLGRLNFKALASAEGQIGIDTTHVYVTISSPPDSLLPLNNNITALVGQERSITVNGFFDGISDIVRVEKAENAVYNFRHGYAGYAGPGKIVGLEAGVDTLTLEFNGVESSPIRVVVKEPVLTHSPSLPLPQSNTGIELTVFPNPASGMVTVEIESKESTAGNLVVTSITGQELLENRLSIQTGVQTIPIDFNALPSGVYFVTLYTTRGKWVERLVKLSNQ
jgi:pimeloyl-ACP methyl ester carboxylesterase